MRYLGVVRELAPTEVQASLFRRHMGANRFAQNWALGFVKDKYYSGEYTSWTFYSLRAEWNKVKTEVAPWHKEVSERAFRSGIARTADGLRKFNLSRNNGKKNKVGFPLFRSCGDRDSVQYDANTFKIHDSGDSLYISKIGWVKLKENFGDVKIDSFECSVQERAGKWFASFRCRDSNWVESPKKEPLSIVGIDLGIGDHLAILSDGTKIDNPKYFYKAEKRLARAQKSRSRKQFESKNYYKANLKVQKIHYKVACKRQDFQHKLTIQLVKTHDVLVVENLSLQFMSNKKRGIGGQFTDAGLGKLIEKLEYKSSWYGTTFVKVPNNYPSSKLCSNCSVKNNQLKLEHRTWICIHCNANHDRDINAAINLRNYYFNEYLTAVGSTVDACGDDVRLGSHNKRLTVKQESISIDELFASIEAEEQTCLGFLDSNSSNSAVYAPTI